MVRLKKVSVKLSNYSPTLRERGMEFNSLLTILLPVKDRPDFAQRTLQYLASEDCEFAIIVADGSINDDVKFQVESFLVNSNLTVTYTKYAPDKDLNAFIKKMIHATLHIRSKYVVWACDDDFYNLKTLREGIDFLENRDGYSSFSGEVVDFNVLPRLGTRDCVKGLIRIQPSNRYCSGRYRNITSVKSDGIIGRLEQLPFIAPAEAIHLASVLKTSFAILATTKVRHIMTIGYVMSVVSLLSGKSYHDESTMLLRQDNVPGSAGDVYITRTSQEELLKIYDDRKNIIESISVDSAVKEFFSDTLQLRELLHRANFHAYHLGVGSLCVDQPPVSRLNLHRIASVVGLYLSAFFQLTEKTLLHSNKAVSLVDQSVLDSIDREFIVKVEKAVSCPQCKQTQSSMPRLTWFSKSLTDRRSSSKVPIP